MQFQDNGTYICDVKNPPDIVVTEGKIKVRVMEKVQVSAAEVYTPPDFPVENGTEAKLPCTFTSTEVISSSTSVTWSFQGEGSSSLVSFFYYSNGKAYRAKSTQFGDRSRWAGDLNRKDASITIANMQFQDNGTYICDVKNPPDMNITPGKIKVRVMEKVQVSAAEVYTPPDFPVENGTEAKLPCTFTSTEVISSSTSVTWSFQGEGSSSLVSFFYYSNGKAYRAKSTQFGDRSRWAGDLNRKDASITIANMQFQDNGTYICDVKNPPDMNITPGKIKVRVMVKGIVISGWNEKLLNE
ncbi:V-set and immunoglobulin domain-containing protein 1 [Protobothrops mucrosquamatus]|uniref:V-set and immunoglobulin domain-containing protein 1 n=1 Tax=Protobothrops mucrosquamatus TaxID=103944 RepID=UPI0010FB2A58|nr:V-set and immunoglobulin domain-containing protein 1 [Protobothrops mucrosquamatus]